MSTDITFNHEDGRKIGRRRRKRLVRMKLNYSLPSRRSIVQEKVLEIGLNIEEKSLVYP